MCKNVSTKLLTRLPLTDAPWYKQIGTKCYRLLAKTSTPYNNTLYVYWISGSGTLICHVDLHYLHGWPFVYAVSSSTPKTTVKGARDEYKDLVIGDRPNFERSQTDPDCVWTLQTLLHRSLKCCNTSLHGKIFQDNQWPSYDAFWLCLGIVKKRLNNWNDLGFSKIVVYMFTIYMVRDLVMCTLCRVNSHVIFMGLHVQGEIL